MNREDLMRKIRACLRLSKSANENEAATALRQAQALMQRHGISPAEALAGGVSESTIGCARRGQNLHKSLLDLVYLIGRGFRCKSMLGTGRGCPVLVVFFGTGVDPKIAAYAFEVLRRQMDVSCRKHLSRVRLRKNRDARGEAFRRGWVCALWQLFPAAEKSMELIEKLDAYKAARWDVLTDLETKDHNLARTEFGDFDAGLEAGRKARLHAGVAGDQQQALEHAK